ncbi:MAG: hypothetical protein ABSH38_13665 [Verrucomicrobiota bacterium]|jgi:hypothetical protein
MMKPKWRCRAVLGKENERHPHLNNPAPGGIELWIALDRQRVWLAFFQRWRNHAAGIITNGWM